MKSILQLIIITLLFPMILCANDTLKKPSTMNMQEVVNALAGAGYQQVKEIKMNTEGAYAVKTIDKQGKPLNFLVRTSADIKAEQVKMLTLAEVVRKVMQANYANVTEIIDRVTYYEMKAHDKEGQPYRLYVNRVTGEINRIKE